MAGNTTFFMKAADMKITWKDIFSDVFKKHTREEGERLFMAGTALSTPHESQMLAEWKKPWLFAYVGLLGLLFIIVMFILLMNGGGYSALVPLVFAGAVISPLAVLLLMWEMNIPRNIPIYPVLGMFFVGGGLSLIFTLIMNAFVGDVPPYLAPLTEEPAKLLALCIFLRNPKNKYALNGLLIGAAIGAGFAAFETMGYAWNYGLDTLLSRSVLAPGGHVAWAALYGGALALVKGSEKLSSKHFADKRFLSCFGIAFGLHFLWNCDFGLVALPLVWDLKFVLLVAAAWIALLHVVKQGANQIMRIPQMGRSESSHSLPVSIAPVFVNLRGLSGVYNGSVFRLTNSRLVLGRDSKRANIVFPPQTPGISSVHCEMTVENGTVFLIDKGSSYGTFLADGTRLTPEKPVPLSSHNGFYLANRENLFEIE